MSIVPEVPLERLGRLAPRDVQGYARSRGWKQAERVGNLLVFNRPEPKSLDQLLVPVDPARPDFSERMRESIAKLATYETRSAEAVVADLLNFDADVIRYRIASSRAERGSLPLSQAIDLLTGAKQSLLAAAHSVLVRSRYHPKLSRTEARRMLEACEMNQTERGSFVVAISCPLRPADADLRLPFPEDTPFTRQATVLLTLALSSLKRAVEEDRINSIVDDPEPLVSANLCDALLRMRPIDEGGVLGIRPSWAPSTRLADATVVPKGIITIAGVEFDAIEDVYRQLRPMEESQPRPWVARVDELRGTDTASGLRQGDVIFTIFDDDEIVRARASLTVEQYKTACELHNPARTLIVVGQLHRGPRLSQLTRISDLRVLDENR
jgi:hypothetical protein